MSDKLRLGKVKPVAFLEGKGRLGSGNVETVTNMFNIVSAVVSGGTHWIIILNKLCNKLYLDCNFY